MINIKLRVLRGLLEECINNIDAGNSSHIEERFSINPFSEEAAYLAGFVAQRMYPKAKRFLCKCHCN